MKFSRYSPAHRRSIGSGTLPAPDLHTPCSCHGVSLWTQVRPRHGAGGLITAWDAVCCLCGTPAVLGVVALAPPIHTLEVAPCSTAIT